MADYYYKVTVIGTRRVVIFSSVLHFVVAFFQQQNVAFTQLFTASCRTALHKYRSLSPTKTTTKKTLTEGAMYLTS